MITGQTKVQDRNKILKQLETNPEKKRVLLVSRVGNEGLDFDKFSRTIIHYDWHFNPAIIDQRNGRVYRRGVKAGDLLIHRLLQEGTYGQRVILIQEKKKQFKDFYLGDSSLDKLIEFSLGGSDSENNKKLFEIVKNLRIDLEPRKEYLLGNYLKL